MELSKIPVDLPEPLYWRLQGMAAFAQRSVEEILASAISTALPPSPNLPDELADDLAEMLWLSDEMLWTAIEPTFTSAHQGRLTELNDLVGERSLTPKETAEQEQLLAAYDRSVLRRAQAFAILARRGHQIPQRSELPRPS